MGREQPFLPTHIEGHLLLLVAEGAKDGVILVAGDVEVMKALPA